MTRPVDDLVHELHDAMHEWFDRVTDWGDGEYRIVWMRLDEALAEAAVAMADDAPSTGAVH